MTIKSINLTNEIKEDFEFLLKNETHSFKDGPCGCAACLFSTYRKKTKQRGRRYGKLTFFLNWLIHKVKMLYLIEKGKAEEIEYAGSKVWKMEPGEYEKAPYIKRTKKILQLLYDEDENDIFDILDNFIDHSRFSIYRTRTMQYKFQKLIYDLTTKRHFEWQKKQKVDPKEIERQTKAVELGKLAQKVADHVRSISPKKITQRELQRIFNVPKTKDLKGIMDILKRHYRINIEENVGYRNKQTFFLATSPKN